MTAPSRSPLPSQRTKRRSAAHRADRLSFTSTSSSSKTPHYAQLPPTVQYLDQLSLSMIVDKKAGKDIRYVLLVQKKSLGIQWRVSRTYNDYQELQKRLLSVMQLGHFCNAQCPWLYSFVKSYFPKEWRFYATSKYVVRKRLEAFTRCFETLHSSVLMSENHCCQVITSAVAMELINFINQDLPDDSEVRWRAFVAQKSSSSSSDSLSSLLMLEISIRYTPGSSDVNTRSSRWSRSSECSLCSPSHRTPKASDATSPESGGEEELGQKLLALSCGHQFHDECIVPRLNESMQCPTCGHAQAFC